MLSFDVCEQRLQTRQFNGNWSELVMSAVTQLAACLSSLKSQCVSMRKWTSDDIGALLYCAPDNALPVRSPWCVRVQCTTVPRTY